MLCACCCVVQLANRLAYAIVFSNTRVCVVLVSSPYVSLSSPTFDSWISITSFIESACATSKSGPNLSSVASSSSFTWFVHAIPDIAVVRVRRLKCPEERRGASCGAETRALQCRGRGVKP